MWLKRRRQRKRAILEGIEVGFGIVGTVAQVTAEGMGGSHWK